MKRTRASLARASASSSFAGRAIFALAAVIARYRYQWPMLRTRRKNASGVSVIVPGKRMRPVRLRALPATA